MGNIFSAQGQVTRKRMIQSGRKSNSFETLYFLITCKYEEDLIKHKGNIGLTTLSPIIKQ